MYNKINRDYDKLKNVERLTHEELIGCVKVLQKYVILDFEEVYSNSLYEEPYFEAIIKFRRIWYVNSDCVIDEHDIAVLEKII